MNNSLSLKNKSLQSERDKIKKSKKKRHRKMTSSESESTSGSDYEGPKKKEQQKEKMDKNMMESAFCMAKSKEKKDKLEEKNKCILDRPGSSGRELNPYWKDGGTGLPKDAKRFSPLESTVGDGGLDWLKRSLARAKDTAREMKVPLEEVVKERWGSLKELESLITEAEKKNFTGGRIRSERHFEKTSRQQFLKPSDEAFSSTSFSQGAPRKNWMKKPEKAKEKFSNLEPVSKEDICQIEEKPAKILTDTELNALAAKAVKAEILGNKSLSEKLKSELEEAKKLKAAAESNSEKPTETVLLTRTDSRGFTVPVGTGKSGEFSGSGKRKRKVETHEPGGRVRYFPDDNKYSLKEMFEREKTQGRDGDEEKAFLKSLGKRKSKNYDEEEGFLDAARYEESEEKIEKREKAKSLRDTKKKQKTLEGCRLCLENKNESKRLIVEIGSKCYLCLPEEESLTEGHCIIAPIHHTVCGTVADEDVWEEIQTFRKRLCDIFLQRGQDVIFFENARSLNKFPHMALHCVPLDKEQGDLAPIYFKKALLESETEWSNNKKVIDLKSKGLRNSVPKGLPYFAVDFGRESGFAHVIEDERLFPHNFAQEIIGGMLDLDHRIWRKHQKQDFSAQRDKFFKFTKLYNSFKRFENKKGRSRSSSSSDADSSD